MNRLERLRDDGGNVAVIVAILITVMIGMTALVVDVGSLYVEQRRLQSAADAAALAGVQELPASPSAAVAVAEQYASTAMNENKGAPTVQISSVNGPNDTIRVQMDYPDAPLYFARIWGLTDKDLRAVAVAQVQSPSAYSHGVMPFGIMSRDPSETAGPFGYTLNETVVLKQGAQAGESGNFQFLALTDPPGQHVGGKEITDALSGGGVDNPVYLDALYNTKTGMNGNNIYKAMEAMVEDDHSMADVVSAPDEDGVVHFIEQPGEPDGCPRLIICPIIVDPGPPVRYNWTELNGSKPVRVVGFAYFFVESVGRNGNESFVVGRFIKPVDEDALEYGPLQPWGPVHYSLID